MQAPSKPKAKLTKEQRRKQQWYASKEGQDWLAIRRARADWSRLEAF